MIICWKVAAYFLHCNALEIHIRARSDGLAIECLTIVKREKLGSAHRHNKKIEREIWNMKTRYKRMDNGCRITFFFWRGKGEKEEIRCEKSETVECDRESDMLEQKEKATRHHRHSISRSSIVRNLGNGGNPFRNTT